MTEELSYIPTERTLATVYNMEGLQVRIASKRYLVGHSFVLGLQREHAALYENDEEDRNSVIAIFKVVRKAVRF